MAKGIVERIHGVGDPNYPNRTIGINANGSINSVTSNPTIGTLTDKTFDPDGSSHIVIAANAARLNYLIFCPKALALNPNGDSIFINFGAAATANGDSFEIVPGDYFPPANMPLYLGDIYAIGNANITKAAAKEFT